MSGQSLFLRLTRLAVPISLGALGGVVMGLTDSVAVGQLAPSQLPAFGLGWTINGPALVGAFGLLFGVQVLVARAVGAGQPAKAGAIWRKGLVIAAIAGVAVWLFVQFAAPPLYRAFGVGQDLAVPGAALAGILGLALPAIFASQASIYLLQALQRPGPAAAVTWATNGVNLALNLLLVPRFGAMGSAFSTVLSRLFQCACLTGYVLLAPALKPYLVRGVSDEGYGALLRIGIAAALSSATEAGSFSALSVIAARSGGAAVAAFGIATGGLVTLVSMIAQGYAAAGSVLVADAVGRGSDTARIGWTAIATIVAAMVACGLLCIVFASEIARAFTADPAIAAAVVGTMVLVACLMIPDGTQMATDQILRARGDNWLPTALRLVPFVLVAPPLALYLAETRHLGLTGVFLALLAASTLACAAQAVRLATLKKTDPAP